MLKQVVLILSIGLILTSQIWADTNNTSDSIPEGFVYIIDIDPSILQEVRYAGTNNFIGRQIDGYLQPTIIISQAAAKALSNLQAELKKVNKGLKIFDAYRPQKAVNHFVRWARNPEDTLMKAAYYPEVQKNELFKRGYIASRSGHTRGSTVDLTIIDLTTGAELDMGGPYDFFGELSHHNYPELTTEQRSNRAFLKSMMSKHGFRPYSEEWWHYTLRGEPYPETYFDFDVR